MGLYMRTPPQKKQTNKQENKAKTRVLVWLPSTLSRGSPQDGPFPKEFHPN